VPKCKTWKAHLREAVAGTSGRPDAACSSICEVDEASSMDELSASGESFHILDAKLADAFGRVLHGEFGRHTQIMEDSVAQTTRKMLRGRQIAWVVFDQYRPDEGHGYVLDLTFLILN